MDQQVDGRFESVTRFYTQEQFSKIRMAHIAVIGLGGVGSWCVEALARTGINQLTLVDMDDICVTNINRQVHALDETVGHLKVDQLEKRALAINPSLTINKRPFFYTAATSDEFFNEKYDIVIDAIDSVEHKCHLISQCLDRNISIITVGAAGGKDLVEEIQVDHLENSFNDLLLQATRKKLRKKFGFSARQSPWGVHCVYSKQKAKLSAEFRRPDGANRINCQNGWGSLCFLTGALGFAAAQKAIGILTDTQN